MTSLASRFPAQVNEIPAQQSGVKHPYHTIFQSDLLTGTIFLPFIHNQSDQFIIKLHMGCSELLHSVPFPPALYRKRLREEERGKSGNRGRGREEDRRLGLGFLFETHKPLPLNQFLPRSNSLVVLKDGGITLFPQKYNGSRCKMCVLCRLIYCLREKTFLDCF